MIRDRIVVGIRDEALSKRLQLDPDLTLEKAKKIVRQQEAVQEQQQVLKGMEDVTLDEASGSKGYIRERGQPDSYPQKQKVRKCLRLVEDVSSEHSDLNSVFLDTLSLTNETSWAINVMVEGGQVKFKVDTGAEVTAIS
ncbi:hypothetical protein EMCRGX_G028754 [Ephydatia muelleri]